MVRISGWSFTCHTDWIDDWHWRSIFGWLINRTYIGSPLEYPNPRSVMPFKLLGAPIGLWCGSEALSYLCCFFRLMDFHKAI